MPAYARTIERFLDDACIEGGKAGLHQCRVRKVAAALHIHLIDQFYLVGQAQALGGRAAIGAYQTARPQLDSTEPAQHQYRDTVAALPFYGLEYGTPGRAARLAVDRKSTRLNSSH